MVSIAGGDHLRRPVGLPDFSRDEVVVTFEGLTTDTPTIARLRALLQLLREKMKTPVDIEFASDGRDLYLLQCRPQGETLGAAPAPIPPDLPRDRVLFSAHRYVSNGHVRDISHVVYVDPDAYASLEPDRIREVGRAVGRLNRLLPKRQFVLMGPGRWGSRGDIHLGVPVTYADISNAAMLIEIARRKGGYVPDLSFGTHFFQDLVESSIRYLPLYPDDPEVAFNASFFTRSANALRDLLPEFEPLADVLRVIDVPRTTGGQILRVLMNDAAPRIRPAGEPRPGDHWRWRLRMAQRIAALVDRDRFGIKAVYVFGSTKNGTAGPASDIDLLVHGDGDPERRADLEGWLDGWSRALGEVNYLRTGYRTDGLLDVHYVTDADIARGDSYASKIGAITDAARPLPPAPVSAEPTGA
jgi:pyruvate,water dikinase